jgi:hypothetical protein
VSYHVVTNSLCQYFPPLPTCCMCVCDLRVVVRNRDSDARVVVVLRIVAVVGGGHAAQILSGAS